MSVISNMTPKISSFAVLDLETTNLPSLNFNKTNITEIAIHGFNTQDVANAVNLENPRINHKLTLLFNPRMIIHPDSEKITALDNYILEHESALDVNAGNVIINFLKHLRRPVCLVAHNGNHFDFQVLKHALSNLGLELPNDVMCLDSLVAIKGLDLAKETEKNCDMEFIPLPVTGLDLESKLQETVSKIGKISEQIEGTIGVLSVSDEIVQDNSNEEKSSIMSNETLDKIEYPFEWQKFNETTPKRPPNFDNVERKRKRLNKEEVQAHITPPGPSSRKSLFNPKSTPSKTVSYKLGTIYERLFGVAPEVAHHAEADVITLKKIMLRYGKSFVDYAEQNAKPFSQIKKLGAR